MVGRDKMQISRLILAMVPAFLALLPSSSLATATVSDPDDNWSRMESFLRILWSGDTGAKRKAASNSFGNFTPLFFSESERGEKAVLNVVQSLQSFLRTEEDDWIEVNVLKGLMFSRNPLVEPLFVDALRDSSPNIRWDGVRWFARRTNP